MKKDVDYFNEIEGCDAVIDNTIKIEGVSYRIQLERVKNEND